MLVQLSQFAPQHEMDVLRAAARSGTVRRVVMTSSTDAIVHGHAGPGRVSTETDWSVPEKLAPYPKSKMHAERVA